ncbi:hypothetical protein BC829DRAFT_443661 [Chytridium lagenaria]|nr:hypothetical protein BC829DRAFT_443661 [Chytridium lagenaria]
MGKMMPSTEITGERPAERMLGLRGVCADVAIELTALITSNLGFHLKSLDALLKLYSRLTTSANKVGSTAAILESLLQNQKATARKNGDEDPVSMCILLLEAIVDIVKGKDGVKTRDVADNDAVVHRQETLVAVSEDTVDTACEAVASLEGDTTEKAPQKDNALDLQASILGGGTIERTALSDGLLKERVALVEPGVYSIMESTWSIYAGRFSTKKIWVNSNVLAEPNSNDVEDQTDSAMAINETALLEDELNSTGSVPSTEKPLRFNAIMDSYETLSSSATDLEEKDEISTERFETCDANEADVAEDHKTSTPNVASSIAQSSESLVENVILDAEQRLGSYSGDIACDVSDGTNARVDAGEDVGLVKSALSDTNLDADNADDVEDPKPTNAAFDEECSTDMTGNMDEHAEEPTSTVTVETEITKGVQANFNQETNSHADEMSALTRWTSDENVDDEAKEASGIYELERDAILELGANDDVMRMDASVMESLNDNAVNAVGESAAGDEDKDTLKVNSEVSAKSITSPSEAIKTTRTPMEPLIAQRERRKGTMTLLRLLWIEEAEEDGQEEEGEAVLGEADSFSIEAMVEMSAERHNFENEEEKVGASYWYFIKFVKVIPTPSQKKKAHRSIPQEDDSSLEFLVQQRMSRSKYDPIDAIGRPKRVYEDGVRARVGVE